jgi:hypothetical protein
MEKLLKMDRFHLVIIMCQHCAHYKACKMDFGPSFFLSNFGPPNHAKTLKFDHKFFKGFLQNTEIVFNQNSCPIKSFVEQSL